MWLRRPRAVEIGGGVFCCRRGVCRREGRKTVVHPRWALAAPPKLAAGCSVRVVRRSGSAKWRGPPVGFVRRSRSQPSPIFRGKRAHVGPFGTARERGWHRAVPNRNCRRSIRIAPAGSVGPEMRPGGFPSNDSPKGPRKIRSGEITESSASRNFWDVDELAGRGRVA